MSTALAASSHARRRHPQVQSAQATAHRWWACWSPQQQCVHLERERDALEINLRAFALNRVVEYVPLAIFDCEEASRVFLTEIQAIRDRRQRGNRR